MSRPLGYLARRHWGSLLQSSPAGLLQPQHEGVAHIPHWPYTWGNPLAINRWCSVRPLEWGLSAPPPVCTFSSDVILRGPLPTLGWFSYLGDITYYERASSDVNVIHQHLQLQHPAVLTHLLAQVVIGRNPNFQAPVPLPHQPPYSEELLVFQPCTIMSYISANNQISAVVLQPENIAGGLGSLRRMSLYASTVVPFTGLTVGDVVDVTRVFQMQGRPAGMQRPSHPRPSTSREPPNKRVAGNG